MSGLAEFLLARIAEDEAEAQGWPDDPGPPPTGYPYWVDGHGRPIYRPRARVLAECEAKRRVVEELSETGWLGRHRLLAALALPYADHPDYRSEWAQ